MPQFSDIHWLIALWCVINVINVPCLSFLLMSQWIFWYIYGDGPNEIICDIKNRFYINLYFSIFLGRWNHTHDRYNKSLTKITPKKNSIGSTRSIGKELKLTKTYLGPYHSYEELLFIQNPKKRFHAGMGKTPLIFIEDIIRIRFSFALKRCTTTIGPLREKEIRRSEL